MVITRLYKLTNDDTLIIFYNLCIIYLLVVYIAGLRNRYPWGKNSIMKLMNIPSNWGILYLN